MHWKYQAQPSQFYSQVTLGDCSVVDKDQIDNLEGLCLNISSGYDIIIDLWASNGKRPA